MEKFTLLLDNVRTDKINNFVLGESFICLPIDYDDVTFTFERIEFEYSEHQEDGLRQAAIDVLTVLDLPYDDISLTELIERALLAELDLCNDPEWDESRSGLPIKSDDN
jgi:hypothetical protein